MFFLLAISLGAAAQIYKSVDQNGNTVYSDTPPTDGSDIEKVKLGTTNSLAPPPDLPKPKPIIKEVQTETSAEITSPVMDTTIPIGAAGNFLVEASVTPATGAGVNAQLLVDGSPAGQPQSGTTWALNNTNPGTHILTVEVIDSTGKTLAASAPITVHVMRTIVGH